LVVAVCIELDMNNLSYLSCKEPANKPQKYDPIDHKINNNCEYIFI
jgi:hypothetical protein